MASVKEAAKQAIDDLPDDASIDDIMYTLYIQTKCERADRKIDDGRGIPHEEAKQRIRKWLK